MKTIMFFVLSFLFLGSSPAWSTAEKAQAFFKTKLDAVLLVLQENSVNDQVKKERVLQIIIPVFDLELMAKLSAGRTYWSGFSDTQKQRFTDTFSKRLQDSYLGTIMKFNNEQVAYHTPTREGKKIDLPLELVSEGTRYGIVYKLYETRDTWKIYDVEIEGVSILKSYRAQINEILGKADFEELIQRFEQPSP